MPKPSSRLTTKSRNYYILARQKCTPSAHSSDHFERNYHRAPSSTIIHRHRLISTHHSLTLRVPHRLRSDRRSPLRIAQLRSDVPHRNLKLHAQGADECTGHPNVNFVKPLVASVESVATSSQCATRHPAPYAPVSRTTRPL